MVGIRVRGPMSAVRRRWPAGSGAPIVARALSAPAWRGLVRFRVEGARITAARETGDHPANHLSFFDPVLLLFALPRREYALGKAEYTRPVEASALPANRRVTVIETRADSIELGWT